MQTKIVHPELSYEITGICFQIHKELGRFCRERQYADRFEELLKDRNIKFKREVELKNIEITSPKGNIADFIIEDKVIVDFKAKKFVTREDYFQMQRYLQSVNLELGLIINFQAPHLKPKRVLNIRNKPGANNSEHSDVIRNIRIAPIVSAIAAIGENRELGKDNQLLWRIPEDLKRFRKLTEGHPVIMGRKTYESIGKPLPKRTNIVITRQTDYKAAGCIVVGSVEEAIAKAKEYPASSAGKDQEEIFIIGGGEIYKQALPLVDKLYLTVVKGSKEADTYFPEYGEFSRILKQSNSNFENHEVLYLELTR